MVLYRISALRGRTMLTKGPQLARELSRNAHQLAPAEDIENVRFASEPLLHQPLVPPAHHVRHSRCKTTGRSSECHSSGPRCIGMNLEPSWGSPLSRLTRRFNRPCQAKVTFASTFWSIQYLRFDEIRGANLE